MFSVGVGPNETNANRAWRGDGQARALTTQLGAWIGREP